MRKLLLALVCCLGIFLSFPGHVFSQDKAITKISSLRQNGEMVLLSLTSSQPFIVGGNIYVLHIGNHSFRLSDQSGDNNVITFMLPVADFNTLKDASDVYLSYGNRPMSEDQARELSTNPQSRCWSVGRLEKNQLSK